MLAEETHSGMVLPTGAHFVLVFAWKSAPDHLERPSNFISTHCRVCAEVTIWVGASLAGATVVYLPLAQLFVPTIVEGGTSQVPK
jgi:hypothetical protein